jgi:hypothetical protein
MDKRTAAKQIAKVDSKHQARPVKQYLERAITCNKTITVKITDGYVSMFVDNVSAVPVFVPKSQQFAIWFGIDPQNSEEPIPDQTHTYQLQSLLKYFS